jgi:hypothetical protein
VGVEYLIDGVLTLLVCAGFAACPIGFIGLVVYFVLDNNI